ncbi:PaaX family transcriptional regulator [Enemella sp. A6]|uniref:PaaX family transcriptional regulator n=1 Tax=Enemella sp. A6 TaxID=3440152 RepID=UPI003EB779E2
MSSAETPRGTGEVPRHQQLIVTIFGLYARRGELAVSAVIALLGELGAPAPAVRSSVSRLKKRGVLVSRRDNGSAAYALSEDLQHVFGEGDRRIFSVDRAGLDEPWLLAAVTVPEAQRSRRHLIRSLLTKRGFGSVTPGLWIAPGRIGEAAAAELERHGLADYVDLFLADYRGELARKIDQWWDLPQLAEQYEEFLAHTDPVVARWESAEPTPREAFVDYIPLVTRWRRLPYLDPGLPLELLPPQWPGQRAAETFLALHHRLGPLAARHVEELIPARGSGLRVQQ